MQRKIAVLTITSIIALIAGFVPGIATTEFCYQNLSWFFMMIIAVSAIASFWGVARQIVCSEWLARHKAVFISALLLVGCAVLLSPPDFRILADETNLLGVSFEMHRGLKTRLPLEGLYFYHGMFEGLTYKTEMRPPGYPFLLSVVHSIIGYRPGNALILNLGLAWLSLVLIYSLIAGYAGKIWGWAAMIMLAAFPAFVQSTCSAGFEIYNLFLVLLMLLMVTKMVEGRVGAAPVISVLLLLAFSRYESIVGFVCFAPLILFIQSSVAAGQRSADSSGSSGNSETVWHLLVWAFPLLLVPALWLRRLTFNAGSFQVQHLDDAFAATNFLPNAGGWLKYFTLPEFSGFIGPIILAVAFVGLILRLKSLVSSAVSARMKIFEISAGAFFLLHLLIRLFYTQGNPINPYTARLVVVMLPCLVFLAVSAAICVANLQKLPSGSVSRLPSIMVAFAFIMLITSWPMASGSRGTNNIALYREFKWVRQQLARLNIGEESIIVCQRPTMYVPLGYSAIGPEYLTANAAKIAKMLEICAYNRLIFVEAVDYKTARSNMPSLPAAVSGLKTEILFETQMTGSEKLKITSFTR